MGPSDERGRPTVTPPPATTLRAHAKLTRTLRMTGLRADGFHLIDAEMVTLDLHDLITVEPLAPGSHTTIEVAGPYAAGVPTDESNLVSRALALVNRAAHVTIDKLIPHGGGLGGGSTDAAAVLRWAGYPTSPEALSAISRLGADIPFCLVAGRARVTGIGEIIETLDHIDREITLIIPPLSVSTPAAYRAWDDLGGPTGNGPNDLEVAALTVEPRMAWWRDTLTERLGQPPVLAGSGATWFTEKAMTDAERDNALAGFVDEGARIVVARTVAAPFGPNPVDE